MRKKSGALSMLLLIFFSCRESVTIDAIEQLGGALPTDTAQIFAVGKVSTDSYEHSAPSISPDGKTIIWSIIELPSWKASILEMNYRDGKWTEPKYAAFSDSTTSDISPSFSPDGNMVYFSSARPLPSGKVSAQGNVLWSVERTDNGWGIPQPLDSAISSGGEYAPSIASNGHLYFTFGPAGSPDWNIAMATQVKGPGGERLKLPPAINTSVYEDGAFIAPDESYLIFESDRPGGIAGGIDLYISFRSGEGEWKEPVNMGSAINSDASERFAEVSPDGRFLFFGSNRRKVNGDTNFDIYWIDASIIDELKNQMSSN
jgi:WD40-like Beta Propeller Repeat